MQIAFHRLILNNGAEYGIRTRDPHLGKVVLYQLSQLRVRKEVLYGNERAWQAPNFNFFQRGTLCGQTPRSKPHKQEIQHVLAQSGSIPPTLLSDEGRSRVNL